MYPQFILAAALALAATGGAYAQQGRLDDQPMFASGQLAFEKICARCHTGREDAVGPDLRSGDYDTDILSFFARHGSGPMPAFTESMIDNATLQALTDHVVETSQGGSQ